MGDIRKAGDLMVWWIPQVLMAEMFYVSVSSVDEAVKVLDVLADYDRFQFENNIKPDYSNAGGNTGGLFMWDLNAVGDNPGWVSWYDKETGEDDVWEYLNMRDDMELRVVHERERPTTNPPTSRPVKRERMGFDEVRDFRRVVYDWIPRMGFACDGPFGVGTVTGVYVDGEGPKVLVSADYGTLAVDPDSIENATWEG